MKEIIAIIRPGKWQATKAELIELGVTSYTTHRVLGRGRQRGLRHPSSLSGSIRIHTVPKRMIWLWLSDQQVEPVVKALTAVNQTGAHGDGKIFVCPAEDALRVRTGDRGELAVL